MPITLQKAGIAIQAAIDHAHTLNIDVCVSVCDVGGRLIAFSRMDQSNWASIYGAQGKAITSVACGCNSGKIPPTAEVMHRICELEGNNMIFAQGAVPIIDNGELIGAIGVGGASGAEDDACAEMGAMACVKAG